jgi:thioesterase domain, putative
MDELTFQQFLYGQIPITEKMKFEVIKFEPSSVKMMAKLEPNINHKCTGFAGSINSLMTLCGWGVVFANVKEFAPNSHIVIQRSNIEYLFPIEKDFVAECNLNNKHDMEKLQLTFNKFNRARIKLNVYCKDDNKLLSKFEGQYVVFR